MVRGKVVVFMSVTKLIKGDIMKIIFFLTLVTLSSNLFAKDKVVCKSFVSAQINTPNSVTKVMESINNEIKNPEKVKSVSTSISKGAVVVCVVIEGE